MYKKQQRKGIYELGEEAWWRSGANFRWCFPKLNTYVPADPQTFDIGFNRYPHNIIGVEVQLFGRCWGVRWKRTLSGS